MNTKSYWWDAPKTEVSAKVFDYIETISLTQGYRSELNKRNLRLYGDYDALGIYDNAYDGLKSLGRLTYNLIQQCVDTAAARIAKNKPKPKYLTVNGNPSLQRRAQSLEKFTLGISYKNKDDQEMQKMFRSAAVFGTGAVKVFAKDGEIKAENKFTPSLMVDECDAVYGKPFTLYETTIVSKYWLSQMYPKHAEAIEKASVGSFQYMVDIMDQDQCVVVEAWKLASGKDKADGRHVICINGATFLDEDYNKTYFPFVFFRYRQRLSGFWGEGIAEIITGIQVELNKVLRTFQMSMHLGSIPKLFIKAGTKVPEEHLNNEIGAVVKYYGEKPEYSPLMGIPQELWPSIENYIAKGRELIGLSDFSMSGNKPSSLTSGKALDSFNDIETERFSLIAQDYEQAHVDLWKLYIEIAKDLSKTDKKFAVTSLDKKGITKIKWSDVNMEEDEYTLQCYPVGLMSTQPAGKLNDVTNMMDRQLIDRETALDMLDFPDTEKFFQMATSKRRHTENVIEKIVDNGEYIPPSEYLGAEFLTAGIQQMSLAMFYYQDRNLEPERLELFARWISDAQIILEKFSPQPTQQEQMQADQMMTEQEGQQQMPPMLNPEEALIMEQLQGANVEGQEMEQQLTPPMA